MLVSNVVNNCTLSGTESFPDYWNRNGRYTVNRKFVNVGGDVFWPCYFLSQYKEESGMAINSQELLVHVRDNASFDTNHLDNASSGTATVFVSISHFTRSRSSRRASTRTIAD